MASINWGQVGSVVSGLTTALTNAGVTGAAQTSVLGQIGTILNPNESAELQICAQLLQFAANPALEQALALKLATTAGVSPTIATLALSLGTPGVDVVTRVLQIETLIKAGG